MAAAVLRDTRLARRWIIGLLLFAISLVGYSVVRYFADQSNYMKGHQAYQQANCDAAIGYFDPIVNNWRLVDLGGYYAFAQRERTVCFSFQAAVDQQQSEDFSAALASYAEIVSRYGDSVLAATARNNSASLFGLAKPSELASQASCKKLNTILEEELMPKRDVSLPPFYFACGQTYEDDKNWASAITFYENFLADYQNHSLASDVETALARSIVAEAKAAGTGILPVPERSGSTSRGVTEAVIQNDSPERLRIVFSGPESHVEELDACRSCKTYTALGPLNCPQKGPVGHYTLKPGQYNIVVEPIRTSRTTSWTGNWTLRSGYKYHNCFYIVTKLAP